MSIFHLRTYPNAKISYIKSQFYVFYYELFFIEIYIFVLIYICSTSFSDQLCSTSLEKISDDN